MPFQNPLGRSAGSENPFRCNKKMSMQQTYSYLDNGGKSRKPRVYTRAEWGAQRERIKLHYFDEDLNLSDVKGIMSSRYDFHATEKQYKTRIKVWGLEKKVKTEEMRAIIRIREKRKKQGKESIFKVRNRIVPDQKIERFQKSHKEPISLESPPPPTPSDIECFTPRPDDGFSPVGSPLDNIDWAAGIWEPSDENPGCSYARSNTPLHEAARSGNSSEVQLLLDTGHSYNQKNFFGQTPLHIAAASGHHCVVQILLEAGASVDTLDDYSWTPLQCASRNGHSSVVRKLLEWRADVAQTDDFHRTPLHWAAANGHERIVRILITAGANLDWHDGGGSGLTPLQLAANGSHAAAVYELLVAGASTNLVDSWGLKRTALHLAAKAGNEIIIQLLLDFHARPCVRDSLERTSLHWAAKNGHEAVVEKLLSTGRFNESLNSPDVCWTPLHWAAMNGHEAVVKRLIFAGADLNAECDEIVRSGVTPLHLAAGGGYQGLAKRLVSAGANIGSYY